MAIKLKAASDLGNIISISVTASASTSPAQLSVRYLTNQSSSVPQLGTNVNTFNFGGITFNGVLISQSSHREQGANYLVREWMDNSVELDQNCIVLYRAGLTSPATNITDRTFSIPTINITRTNDGSYNYSYSSTAWTSSTARLSSTNSQILGAESYSPLSCTRSEVYYNPNDALDLMEAPNVTDNGFKVSYEGTYRSVLSSIYGDFGCTFWWNWTNDNIEKIDVSSGPGGGIADWGFDDAAALDNNCRIFSYDIGATRVGVSTRSNWHVYRNTWDYPEEDNTSSSNANFRQFVNSYNSGSSTYGSGGPSQAVTEDDGTVTYRLPPYVFIETTRNIKSYSSFSVSPVKGPNYPSITTAAYNHVEGLRLYDALASGTLSIAGYGVIGSYTLPPADVFNNPNVGLWLVEQGFDRGLSFLAQIYAYLGIDSSYTILLAFELDGSANSSGSYELYYPFNSVSYTTGTSSQWYFRSERVTYTPEATARGFDSCDSTQDRSNPRIGLWRQPSDTVYGNTQSSAFANATSGCLIQIQQVDMLVDLWRIGIEFGKPSNTYTSGGNYSQNQHGGGGGVTSRSGGVTSFSKSVSITNPEELAYWLENGLVIIAVRGVNSTINVNTGGTGVNCGDRSDTVGFVSGNELVLRTPNNQPQIIEFTPNTGTFNVPASWAGGSSSSDVYNPGYGTSNAYNNNSTTIGAGSAGVDPCADDDDNGSGDTPTTPETPAPETETTPAITPEQETYNIPIQENIVSGTKEEPGLLSAYGTQIDIGGIVQIIMPSLASYRVTSEADIEEISRQEEGTQYEFVYEEPEDPGTGDVGGDSTTPGNNTTPTNTYNRSTESNTWRQTGGLSNNAGLQHSVIITDITDFDGYQGVPSSLTSPQTWLQTAAAETDGFYFPVSAGLNSLSAQFASDGTLSVQYTYKQIAQSPTLERPSYTTSSSTNINIYS